MVRDVVIQPLTDVDIEALWEMSIPCDGVSFSDEVCDRPAEFTVVWSHGCSNCGNKINKCRKHYEMWREYALDAGLPVRCLYCRRMFYDLDDFVRYGPIGKT